MTKNISESRDQQNGYSGKLKRYRILICHSLEGKWTQYCPIRELFDNEAHVLVFVESAKRFIELMRLMNLNVEMAADKISENLRFYTEKKASILDLLGPLVDQTKTYTWTQVALL